MDNKKIRTQRRGIAVIQIFICIYLFSGADSYPKGNCISNVIFGCTRKKIVFIFFTSGRELYFPARLWYSPLVANCSFHGPVYFSGIPPQGLPLRLFVVYHSFRKMQEHFIENISLSVRGSWWSYDRGNRLRRVIRFLTLLRFLECATLRFNTPSSHELYNIYYE